jgi:CheY-specific phosphatase CheX
LTASWSFPILESVQQEILEVFVEAVRQVLSETDIAIETVGADEDADTEDNVITSVGLTGDLRGIFMIRTDTASTAAILRAMTGGVKISLENERISEMQMAAMGELTNQISGRAITLLFDHRLRCDITPPAVIAAHHLQSLVPDLATSRSLSIRGPFGRLTVFLGLRDMPAKRMENTPGDAFQGKETASGDAIQGKETASGDAFQGKETASGAVLDASEDSSETRRKY